MISPSIESQVQIQAPAHEVWQYLTDPHRMVTWMGEPDMALSIDTDWTVGSAIVIRGFHHIAFENDGEIVEFVPAEQLTYTHRSSISSLPDEPESFTTFSFQLVEQGESTILTFRASNFPTETIFKHLRFYWNGALQGIKRQVEVAWSSEAK